MRGYGLTQVVEVLFLGRHEVKRVTDGLGETDADVKGVHDRLPEILIKGLFPQLAEVDAVETVLVPADKQHWQQ